MRDYSNPMEKVFLLVDNMRIGGFQRLALDQAYGLSEAGYLVTIFVMDDLPGIETPNFIATENELLLKMQINFVSLGNSRRIQLVNLCRMVSEFRGAKMILSHSLRATFFLFVAACSRLKILRVITTIHQLPTLSAPRQRLQRFIYAQFSWKLFAYSNAVVADWNFRFEKNQSLISKFSIKKISLLRNGIYLKRLPSEKSELVPGRKPRLIYLGRNTSWKGVSTFLEIASQPLLKDFDILFMVPKTEDIKLGGLNTDLLDRIEILAGKTLSSYKPRPGDVHLYPANYGNGARFIESVSLNCLELACVGTPTLLTKGGLETWPDLIGYRIFHETDWQDYLKVANQISEISKINLTEETVRTLASRIDISHQINQLHTIFR